MKKLSTLLFACLLSTFVIAQTSTSYQVYQLFQEKCVTCHNHASPEAGLDLEGTGSTPEERIASVRNHIVGITAANPAAASKEHQYIYAGQVERSFIFRKINDGLEPGLTLETEEGTSMPPVGSESLTNEEKELIRQWIVFGAPAEGEVVDPQVLYDYYNVNGVAAFDTPPPAPAPGEGYQVKLGPYFLNPAGQEGSEREYFLKHDLNLPEDIEVNRVDLVISSFSHHIVMYHYADPSVAETIEPGLRTSTNHNNLSIVTTAQENAVVWLPEGTAFMWDKDIVLDLNSHYINYSAATVYKAEAYFNIYTQPAGTAAQQMQTTLVPYPWIYIPNNGNTITFENELVYPTEIFVWAIGGHTHAYGTDYKVWERQSSGEKGNLIYDASCSQGIPDCVSPYFDYQHIPVRIFDPLRKINMANGLIQQASYLNDGPEPVSWGSAASDEMMLMGLMYVLDTTGLNLPVSTAITEEEPVQQPDAVQVYPNPMRTATLFTFPKNAQQPFSLHLYDTFGKEVYRMENITTELHEVKRSSLTSGLFLYRAVDANGKAQSGKLFVE